MGKIPKSAAAIVALGLSVVTADAANVMTQTLQGGYSENQYGGINWTTFTGMMDASHTVSSAVDFTAIGAVDALWVDQDLGDNLTGAEISSISNFVSAGHRAVMIGENNGWLTWNASLMALVGGTLTGTCDWSIGAPSSSSSLTDGVGAAQNICGSLLHDTGGVDLIFDNDMAGVYTIGAGEVLVILDSNWNDDTYIINEDNAIFAQNVVDWLGEPIVTSPVPLPAGILFLGAGLGGLAALRRRKS